MSDFDWLVMDTHIWIWWINQDNQIPAAIERELSESTAPLAISSASIYEAMLQIGRGRVIIGIPLDQWLRAATTDADIAVLNVDADIAARAATLPLYHGDPLDRMIIATTLHHNAQLASMDRQFPRYEALAGRLVSGND